MATCSIVDEAGVSLSPLARWVLVRLELDRGVAVDALARAHGIDAEAMSAAVSQLATRRLVTMPSNGGPRAPRVTTAGCDVLARIVAVRRSHLGT